MPILVSRRAQEALGTRNHFPTGTVDFDSLDVEGHV